MDEEKLQKYLEELENEKSVLESVCSAQPSAGKLHSMKLVEQEIQRVLAGGSKNEAIKFVDVYRERPIRLTVCAVVPVKDHPKFNFVGKLLGPQGNSLKRLQEETLTKMAVLGRGSMRNKLKEEELRESADPKYQHLHEDLHVEITAFAPPAEAHARIAFALAEIRKYLIPNNNDEIRQQQMRELERLTTDGSAGGVVGGMVTAECGSAGAPKIAFPIQEGYLPFLTQPMLQQAIIRNSQYQIPTDSGLKAPSAMQVQQKDNIRQMSSPYWKIN